jgi:hypothetical protein
LQNVIDKQVLSYTQQMISLLQIQVNNGKSSYFSWADLLSLGALIFSDPVRGSFCIRVSVVASWEGIASGGLFMCGVTWSGTGLTGMG